MKAPVLQQFLALAFGLAVCLGVEARPQAGDIPPDALGLDPKGQEVTISGLRGKVVVVVFWATWCGQCRKELPLLERFQRAAGTEQLVVVAVNRQESVSVLRKARRMMRDYQMLFTHDRKGEISDRFGVNGLPHLLMIDRTGRIARVIVGYNKETSPQKMMDLLKALLAEPPTE